MRATTRDSQRRVARKDAVIMVMLIILAMEIVGTHDGVLLAKSDLLRAYAEAATPGNTRAGDVSQVASQRV